MFRTVNLLTLTLLSRDVVEGTVDPESPRDDTPRLVGVFRTADPDNRKPLRTRLIDHRAVFRVTKPQEKAPCHGKFHTVSGDGIWTRSRSGRWNRPVPCPWPWLAR